MPSRPLKIIGARGDWTAKFEGVRLAVIHQHWWTPPDKCLDPMTGAKTDGKRYQGYVEALRQHDRVVMQRDGPRTSDTLLGVTLDRLGYIGVFTFDSLFIHDDGAIALRITGRYA